MKQNRNFGKLKSKTEIDYGPIPLTVVTHHHEEYDMPVFDPETGEQKTEYIESDWDTSEVKMHPTANDYRQMGYLPVLNMPPTDPASEGYHWGARGWEARDGAIRRIWEAVVNPPPPPRRWSRLSLKTAFARAGLLQQVLAFLATVEIAQGYTAAEALTDCDYIEEGYGGEEAWGDLLDGAAVALEKPRAEIDAFLDAIPTEGV